MGVDLSQGENDRNATHINSAESGVDVLVIPTDEEAIIALSVVRSLGPKSGLN